METSTLVFDRQHHSHQTVHQYHAVHHYHYHYQAVQHCYIHTLAVGVPWPGCGDVCIGHASSLATLSVLQRVMVEVVEMALLASKVVL